MKFLIQHAVETTEQIIESSIRQALGAGYTVRPGAMFDFTETPISMDALGAVIWAKGNAESFRNEFPKGWLKQLCSDLGKDAFWVYKFNMGFERGYQIMLELEDGKFFDDSVSKYGLSVRRMLRKGM